MKPCLCFVAACLSLATSVGAEPLPAVSGIVLGEPRPAAPGVYPVAADFRATLGWAFRAKADLLVMDLGFYDAGQPGLAVSHSVGIWDSQARLLVTADVPPGPSTALITPYRYASVEPVTLLADQTYIIGATVNQPRLIGLQVIGPPPTFEMDMYPFYNADPTSIVLDPRIELVSTGLEHLPDITGLDPGDSTGSRLLFPEQSHPDAYSFVANLRLASVPEPDGLPVMLVILGASVLACRRARAQRAP